METHVASNQPTLEQILSAAISNGALLHGAALDKRR